MDFQSGPCCGLGYDLAALTETIRLSIWQVRDLGFQRRRLSGDVGKEMGVCQVCDQRETPWAGPLEVWQEGAKSFLAQGF